MQGTPVTVRSASPDPAQPPAGSVEGIHEHHPGARDAVLTGLVESSVAGTRSPVPGFEALHDGAVVALTRLGDYVPVLAHRQRRVGQCLELHLRIARHRSQSSVALGDEGIERPAPKIAKVKVVPRRDWSKARVET
jgi:hypothetical protein